MTLSTQDAYDWKNAIELTANKIELSPNDDLIETNSQALLSKSPDTNKVESFLKE
jgi:hypothetical protein